MFASLILTLMVATPAPGPAVMPLRELTEIGRTKAVSPACAVMRDLTVPAFAAALKSEARMAGAVPQLIEYAKVKADSRQFGPRATRSRDWTRGDRERLLSQIGSAAATMMQNDVTISRALGDPRLAPESTDPQVLAQRAALEDLYHYQSLRANLVWELQFRRTVAENRDEARELGDDTRARGAGDSRESPDPGQTGLPETEYERLVFPRLTGVIADQDARLMQDWTVQVAGIMQANERRVRAVLFPIAQGCTAAASRQ